MRNRIRGDQLAARLVALALWALLAAWPIGWMSLSLIGGAGHGAQGGIELGNAASVALGDVARGPSPTLATPTMIAETGPAILLRSLAWHLLLAFVSVAIGWPVGRVLERRAAANGRVLAIAALAVALLPPWLLFSAWWTLLAPGNPLHDWLASHGQGALLRRTVLILGCAGWGSAIAAIVVACWRRAADRRDEILDRLDGLRGASRAVSAWRRDRGGVVLALVIVMLALASDTVCFDLAQERSIGFELRSLEAQGAPGAMILRRAAGVSIASAVLVFVAMGLAQQATRRRGTGAELPHDRSEGSASRRSTIVALLPTIVLAMIPLGVLAWRMLVERRPWDFLAVHGEGTVNALAVGAAAGAVGAVLAVAHATIAIGFGSRLRRSTALALIEYAVIGVWAAVAILPSAIVSTAMAEAWGGVGHGWLLDSPIVLVMGTVGRFGLAAVIAGMLAGRMWVRRHGEIERLDGVRSTMLRARAPMIRVSAAAGAMLVAALSAGEVAVATRLEPPGYAWVASSILGAIHYQRPGSVMVAMLVIAIAALVAALLTVTLFSRLSCGVQAPHRRSAPNPSPRMAAWVIILPAALLGALIAGCEHHDPSGCRALEGANVIGGPGVVDGRFDRPRALAIDPHTGEIVVIDKTARVQRFAPNGAFISSFRMPEFELGMPVGISIDDDGTLLIPDTHYHRVLMVDRDGQELRRFGRYGFEPGEFTYPTDVLPLADGSLLIGEYGGVDRLQILDRDGVPRRVIGRRSDASAAAWATADAVPDFERPQSFALSRDRRDLFVVDACNHRIQVLDAATGERRRILGRAGSGAGELSYPWAVVLLPDDSLLVAEQGNSRLQRLDPKTGASLGLFGGRGREPGRLDRPWALDLDDRRVVVADTANNRVLSIPLESILRGPQRISDSR